MAKRDQDVHFLASKEEVERIHEKMDELGIRSMGAYLRKMALDGYCIRLDLQDVKALVSLLRICSNNLNQYAKRANETGSIYRADIEDLLVHDTPGIWVIIKPQVAGLLLRSFTSTSFGLTHGLRRLLSRSDYGCKRAFLLVMP